MDMADIMLAECSGQAWLVRGEQHIDDLLGNTLDPDLSIEVVACESKIAVDALWAEWNEGDPVHMWLIHPGVLRRVKGSPAGSSVVFPPWSAAVDPAGQKVVEGVAIAAGQKPDASVALVRHVAAEGEQMASDLADLRTGLLESRLKAAGVEAGRLLRETKPAADPADADRIDLLLR